MEDETSAQTDELKGVESERAKVGLANPKP